MTGFANRLISLMYSGEKKIDFAARIGVTPQVLNRYLHTETAPQLETVIKIAKKTGVSPAWLQSGEGDKFGSPDQVVAEAMAVGDQAKVIGMKMDRPFSGKRLVEYLCSHIDNMSGWSREEREILKDFIRLADQDPELRADVLHYFDFTKIRKGRK